MPPAPAAPPAPATPPTPEDAAAWRERRFGLAALVLVQVCFGLFPPFGKWAFENDAFSPAAVAGWRIAGGAALLFPLALVVHGRRALLLGAAGGGGAGRARGFRDLPLLLLCSLTGVVLNQGLFLEGLKRTTAVHAGLVMSLIPVLTVLLAVLCRQEAFSPARVLGIGIAFAGGAALLFGRHDLLPASHGTGLLLVTMNAASYACYLILSKPLTARLPPLVIIAWVYLGALLALPYFLAGERLAPPLAGFRRAWLSLAYIVVFATAVAYLLNVYALARVRASTAAFFIYLQPLVTGAAGILWLGEPLTAELLPAAAGLFAGSWLVVRRRPRPLPAAGACGVPGDSLNSPRSLDPPAPPRATPP